MNPTDDIYFAQEHLTEESLAMVAEAILSDRMNDLPVPVIQHVETCNECKTSIVDLCQIIEFSEADTESSDTKNDSNEVSENSGRLIWMPSILSSQVMKVAAAALLLVVSGTLTLWMLQHKEPDNEQLFSEYFDPYLNIVTDKSQTASHDSLTVWMNLGLAYYSRGEYDSALQVFAHLKQSGTQDDTLDFYYGNSLLASRQDVQEAIVIFRRIAGSQTPYSQSARWFLALSLLKANDIEGCRDELGRILQTGPNEKAGDLLSRL